VRNLPQKKFSPIILTAYLVFITFFTVNCIFPILGHDHDQNDPGGCCSVCHEIELAQLLLESLKRIILPVAGLVAYTKERIKKPSLMCRMAFTSITFKVRLNT
jgi:hypothetical protein